MMIRTTKWRLLGVCAFGAIALTGGIDTARADTPRDADETTSGQAQETPGSDADTSNEIVVTARQRGETLVSVPVAATALTANDLKRNNATDFTKVAEMIPQVTIARTPSGNGGSATIRGIGSSQQDAGVEQMVSFAFDGVQVSRGRAVVSNMFDLRQIEVLKGPQALFFGKNAPAGVVALYSANPTDQLTGYVTATYEFTARERRLEGALSGPLTGTLKARAAFRYDKIDGWIKNDIVGSPTNPLTPFAQLGSATKRFAGGEDVAGRLTLQWDTTTAFKATLKASYAHGTGTGEGGSREPWCANPAQTNLISVFLGTSYPEPQADCKLDGHVAIADLNPTLAKGVPEFNGGRQYNKYNVYLGVLNAEYGDGPISVASTSGYIRVTSTGSYNNCQSYILGFCFAYNGEAYTAVSQQFRAISNFDGPINFTVGTYIDSVNRRQHSANLTNYLGIDPATGTYVNRRSLFLNTQYSYSVFGQLRWNPVEQLEVAGGARYTKEVKTVRLGNTYVHPADTTSRPANDYLSTRFSDDNISPEVTVTYHPTPRTTLYGAYKTGYLSGGISNPGVISKVFTATNLLFDSAKAKGGEIGAKGEFFGRSLRADLVVYSYEFSGLQLTQADFSSVPPIFFTKNAAKSRSRGVEASLNWQATPEFALRGAVGYNNSKYLNFVGANCYRGQTAATGCITAGGASTQTLSGKPLYRAPKLSANFGASYTVGLGGGMDLDLTGDATHSSSYFGDVNDSPNSKQPAYWLLNASVTLRSTGGWSLAVIGRNLTNERYALNSLDRANGSVGEISSVVSRPREINLQARFEF
jgi:outer membrane receptor protein involved in Fe transport